MDWMERVLAEDEPESLRAQIADALAQLVPYESVRLYELSDGPQPTPTPSGARPCESATGSPAGLLSIARPCSCLTGASTPEPSTFAARQRTVRRRRCSSSRSSPATSLSACSTLSATAPAKGSRA